MNQVSIGTANIEFDTASLHEVAEQILSILQLQGVELSVLLCNDSFIHPLNRDYRGKDKATDVLSFAQREGEGADADDPLLGDVIISVETAERQAAERNIKISDELQLLLTHGILHLLGYDHIDDDDAEIMEALEREILREIIVEWGIEPRYIAAT